MLRSFRRMVLVTVAGALSLGCGRSYSYPEPSGAGDPTTIALPGPPGAPLPPPSGEARDVEGIDTSELSAREKSVWWSAVNELYAPCPDQAVSIAQCVEEARPCAACRPAAERLRDYVLRGVASSDLSAMYGLRFGPNKIDVDVGASPAKGRKNASVTVMAWHDFQCPHCKMTMPILEEAFEAFPDEVRLVHKFYPLKSHTLAEPAARAAFAAHKQGKYWKMEKLIFDNQASLSSSSFDAFAKDIGLNMASFQRDMNAEQAHEHVMKDKEQGDAAGLTGTPFILINGRPFDTGYFSLDRDLQPWIELEIQLSRS